MNPGNQAMILVVDDEPLNLEIIGEYLDDPRFVLTFAENGQEAWEKLQQSPPFDLIVLDRMMPVMDGMELLHKLKAESRFSKIPVIMQTAAASKEQVAEGLRQGAYYYLTKPYEEEILRSIVESALGEQQRLENLREELKAQAGLMKLLHQAEYHFRTLEEARRLAALLAETCPNPSKAMTGLAELMINAVEHGNLGITYSEKSRLNAEGRWSDEIELRLQQPLYAEKFATVSLQRETNQIRFTITDQGNGFNPEGYLELSAERAFDTHGRGIAMAKMFSFHSIEYQGKGNIAVAIVDLS
ncbi:response regulator [Parvibium lacunae]|uniref:Response regulator n=1 Tax=Parvibium lacunae TaxID=1888893 RepID=A0A368L3G2_9BURK|nr:response regulator [Parvibium lacunae]RCS58023.1 response regulator [Parvibium lacunae]